MSRRVRKEKKKELENMTKVLRYLLRVHGQNTSKIHWDLYKLSGLHKTEMLNQTNKLLRLTSQDYCFPKLSSSQGRFCNYKTHWHDFGVEGNRMVNRPNVCQHFTSFINQHGLLTHRKISNLGLKKFEPRCIWSFLWKFQWSIKSYYKQWGLFKRIFYMSVYL